MGTKMLRGPSLKSLSLLRTLYLLHIKILKVSGEKGCYLDNFSSESGKIIFSKKSKKPNATLPLNSHFEFGFFGVEHRAQNIF